MARANRHIEVFETTDAAKTIDELNDEIEPINFQSVRDIVQGRTQPLAEVFSHFQELTAPKSKGYVQAPKPVVTYTDKLDLMEAEISALKELNQDTTDLEAKLSTLRDRIASNKAVQATEGDLPPSSHNPVPMPPSSGFPVDYEIVQGVDTKALQERLAIKNLENQIKRLEKVTGEWKGSQSIGDKLSKIHKRIETLDLKRLEVIEQQAKHCGMDLDGIITSKQNYQIDHDDLMAIRKLFEACSSSFNEMPDVQSILDRLLANQSLYKSTITLSQQLARLEQTQTALLGQFDTSSKIYQELKKNMEENKAVLLENLKTIGGKI